MIQNQKYLHSSESLLKKLIYQSNNRGCKETDLILSNFSKTALNKMNSQELHDYQYFLSQADADIWDWINEKSYPRDPILQKVVRLIKGNL